MSMRAAPGQCEQVPVEAESEGRARRVSALPLLSATVALAMMVLGVSTLFYTIIEVYRLHVVIPFGDEWQVTYDMERIRAGTYALSSLAEQYNEHRILVPRLFFFIDTFVFGASERFDIAVTFLFQAINAGLLIACIRKQPGSPVSRWTLVGLVLLALFSLRQADNFTIGFQLQFTGVFAFANLAILPFLSGLSRLRRGERESQSGAWWRLASAYALCAVSTCTMANGVLAAPTLFVLASLLRAPKKALLATAAVSVGLAVPYFHGLRQMNLGLPLAEALAQPLLYPQFLAALLGDVIDYGVVILSLTEPFQASEAFGFAGLVGIAAAAWTVARDRSGIPGSAVLLGIMGFAAASACATTYGRVGAGIDEAFEGRYVEVSVLFWTALVLFWAPYVARAARRSTRFAGQAALTAIVATLVAALGMAEIRAPHDMIAQAVKSRTLSDALLSGFVDPQAARYEIWSPAELARPAAILQAAHLSLFAGSDAEARGKAVAAVGDIAPASTCAGSVSAEADPALGPDGVRLSGLAWDVGRDGPVARILTVGPDGRVSGFGSLERPVGRPRRWNGYATASAGSSVSAYAVLADRRLCALGTTRVAGS